MKIKFFRPGGSLHERKDPKALTCQKLVKRLRSPDLNHMGLCALYAKTSGGLCNPAAAPGPTCGAQGCVRPPEAESHHAGKEGVKIKQLSFDPYIQSGLFIFEPF